jgi:CRP/FNR family cyclic AMP-dependent transcriptional regulator
MATTPQQQTTANHLKKLNAGDILFREGDAAESMFVIKKGRLIVFKQKGMSEVELATVGAGAMIGEMAFFDRKPRSASVKADLDSEIIELPFKSLQVHYDAMPEWVKAVVKTVNDHLREANKRIKNLEQVSEKGGGSGKGIQSFQANKLCAILTLVAARFGTEDKVDGGLELPGGTLRKFTIQVFQEPTNKMQMLIGFLSSLGIMKYQDLGEGKAKVNLLQPKVLYEFVEWYNEYLFASEEKKITVEPDEMKIMKALVFYANKITEVDTKGDVKVNITQVQNESMKDLGYVVSVNDFNPLTKKGLTSDKMQEKEGLSIKVNKEEINRLQTFWQIVHTVTAGAG